RPEVKPPAAPPAEKRIPEAAAPPAAKGEPAAAKPPAAGAAEARKVPPEKEKPGKKKKPVEVVMGETPARKKAAAKAPRGEKKPLRVLMREEVEEPATRAERKREAAVVRMKKTEITTPKAIKRRIKVDEAIRVGDLAKKMGVKASDVIQKLISMGMMVTINQYIDADVASVVSSEFGYQVESVAVDMEGFAPVDDVRPEKLRPRAPVVTVMGHVDHGKTSLLDAIRQTHVIDGEAGGITQAIGAHHVRIHDRDIVFLDTPGHEAFTSMRARGAQVTDIVVLVVAADDGVMDQTVEAINHSKAAGVPIIVAMNKMDKAGAKPDQIKQKLADLGLVPEDWGGETIFAPVSAKQHTGIEDLLELILLQADILELKADPDRPARGIIIESKIDRGRGPVATVIIQSGTIREGDAFVSRTEYGKVRALVDDKGIRLKEAGPSMPVEVIGFSGVPQAGLEFNVVEDDRKARDIAGHWLLKEREKELSQTSKVTLEQLYARIREGAKELNVILKADVQGSVEALSEALQKIGTEDVRVRVIHSSTGAVTETDVMLASASDALIIGFKVRPDSRVLEIAEREGVEIKLYEIIYDVIAEVKAAMEGLLEPLFQDVTQGHAEVRELFRVPRVGTVAGCYVIDGKVSRNAGIRLIREGVVVYDGKILSLKRFKEDAREVVSGYECGIGLENYNDIKVGDVLETYVKEEVARKPL
ncbi:MAG TPA: translation initiation factor IF-2, partial [Syntrophales bacterium]|nr:translation initiation factor IF-2 [Syntrophales bacterium]